jgi:hypothetical protein
LLSIRVLFWKTPLKGLAAHDVVVGPTHDGGYYVEGAKTSHPALFVHDEMGTVKATWEGYKKAGPLLVSTEHRGTADGNALRLSFSDVAVTVTGSDEWISAQ